MSLTGYLIQKSEIPARKFQDILDAYSDINLHLAQTTIPEHTLITIITDISIDALAIDLQVPTAKLHKVDYTSRRATPLSCTIFVIDDTNFEITPETVGKNIYNQYIKTKTTIKTEIRTTTHASELIESKDTENMADLSNIKEFLVPKWDINEPSGLEKFIFELKTAKTMGVVQEDKMLIYAAVVKSGKLTILENLTNDQMTDLDEFIIYLRNSFGPSLPEQRQNFASITQKKEENEIEYFNRVEKHYFMSKGTQKPTGALFTNVMKEDIKYQFMKGLINQEIRRLMMINAANVEYNDLGKTARGYASSLRDISKVYTVNTIKDTANESNDKKKDNTNDIKQLEKKIEDMVLAIHEQKQERGVKCYSCGYHGHVARECVASKRTLAQYRKSQERNKSRSQSRERSYGRGGSRTPYPRSRSPSPYRQERNYNNKGRNYSPGRDRRPRYTRSRSRSQSPWRSRSKSNDRYRYENKYYQSRSQSPYGTPRRGQGRRVQFN